MRVTVFGAGAWGTALAIAFSKAHDVILWTRDAEQIAQMRTNRLNERYLPGVALPATLDFEEDFIAAAQQGDLHLVATPSAGLRQAVTALRRCGPEKPLLWVCKGFEAGSGKLPHEVVAEESGKNFPCGVLTGPSFAAEVAAGLPTAITLAARDLRFATDWGRILHQPRLRIYASDDIIGAELGGALKNVIAIAAGICDGLGFGLNARAALLTRGLAEINRLGSALGGKAETLMGLAGMGDLILTCTGNLSRNRQVGLALAEGRSLQDILHHLGHVAEGVPAAREAVRVAQRHGIEMPICEAVNRLLFDGLYAAQDIVEQLLSRDPKHEAG